MSTNRMEAFSDGILAIIITVMVLKLKTPEGIHFEGLKEIFPTLMAYVLSYVYIGIYWANHHHLVARLEEVSGTILWKNLHWIFWMSLLPTATEWMGLNPFEKFPAFFYGTILFMCAVSYHILQTEIIKRSGKESEIARKIGKDIKGNVSMLAYAVATIISFYLPIVGYIVYMTIALLWIVPDSRLEN